MTTLLENNDLGEQTAPAQTTTFEAAPPHGHRIDLEPAFRVDPRNGRATGQGKDVMIYDGEVIGESKEPAFAAARHLLSNGLALPSDRLTTYRNGRPCLYTSVGRAAKLTVSESGKSGPRIVAYREAPVEMLKALRAPPSENSPAQ